MHAENRCNGNEDADNVGHDDGGDGRGIEVLAEKFYDDETKVPGSRNTCIHSRASASVKANNSANSFNIILLISGTRIGMLAQRQIIPCNLPYVNNIWLPRRRGDRPPVVPEGATNLDSSGSTCPAGSCFLFSAD